MRARFTLQPHQTTPLPGLFMVYGAGTLISQVLILREILVLAQGQELKLALGLWCWLLWTGAGSLLGGRRFQFEATPAFLGGLLSLLGLLLPATILGSRSLPALGLLPWGQSLPLAGAFWLFLVLLAPFCLVSGFFFPCACRSLAGVNFQETPGRVYYLETLGAALGVMVLQLLLLGRYAGLSLALATGLGLALAAWVLTRPATLTARLGSAAGVLCLAAAVLLARPLEDLSRTWQWPGRQLLAQVDSPYASLAATREAEQVSFFANNLWQFTHPDPWSAEHQVQLGLLEHPAPRTVLLLGGGVGGLGGEILKTATVSRLDYVELDPQLVQLARELLPGAAGLTADPRVHIIHQDARHFLETTAAHYDVILVALPEPHSAQLNRFYSLEFFRLVAQRLTPGGVFSFSLPGAATSLHPLRAAYLAMAYHTLARVFPQVLAFPGERVRFFVARSPGTLVADPELLVRRLQERHLQLQYVREYYLLDDLSRPRLAYLHEVLARQPAVINSDLTPGCYFYDLVLSAAQEDLGLKKILLFLQGLPPYIPWGVLILTLILAGLVIRRRPGPLFLFQVVVMGLGTMALEIIVLILYQIRWGSLYRQLGLLIAAFMAGMALGAALGSRWASRPVVGVRLLAALQGGLTLLATLLALVMGQGWGRFLPHQYYLSQAGYALVLVAAGCGGGGVFALSAALWARQRPDTGAPGGVLYAADLLGATLGTLGLSLVVLPVWGLLPALYLVAVLHAGAGVVLMLRSP